MRIFREPEAGLHETLYDGTSYLSRVNANLGGARNILVIGSARGGVGKSALTVNVAGALAIAGRKVGIVDADLNSPSVVAMLGMRPGRRVSGSEDQIEPGSGPLGLRVVASNLLADGEPPPISFLDTNETAVAAAGGDGAVEVGYAATLYRLLSCSRFDSLDMLLIDAAPGLEALHRILKAVDRASLLIVSHPSELSARASKDAIKLALSRKAGVVGIVENMTGFNCDGCHSARPLMPTGSLNVHAHETGVPILERLPFDPRLADTSDRGLLFVKEYAEAPLAKQLTALATALSRVPSTRTQTETATAAG